VDFPSFGPPFAVCFPLIQAGKVQIIRKRGANIGSVSSSGLDPGSSFASVGVSHQAGKYASVGPLTRPVTGIGRPLQAGDQVTQYRRDFFRRYSQVLLVEKIVPSRSLHVRDLSPEAASIEDSLQRLKRASERQYQQAREQKGNR
jgi:hypothetical protein